MNERQEMKLFKKIQPIVLRELHKPAGLESTLPNYDPDKSLADRITSSILEQWDTLEK